MKRYLLFFSPFCLLPTSFQTIDRSRYYGVKRFIGDYTARNGENYRYVENSSVTLLLIEYPDSFQRCFNVLREKFNVLAAIPRLYSKKEKKRERSPEKWKRKEILRIYAYFTDCSNDISVRTDIRTSVRVSLFCQRFVRGRKKRTHCKRNSSTRFEI